MRYNQLGRSGLFVSELCLGTMTFGGGEGMWRHMGGLQQEQVDHLVQDALDAGITFIDTADVYSDGQSETLLGQSLRNLGVRRESVVIATKAFGAVGSGPNDRGASRGHIMDAVEGSLKRLRVDHIDLYQMHANDALTPIEETLRALDDLTRAGKIRYVGVSNWPAWRLAKALGIAEHRGYARPESLQAYYTIAGRDLEREIVPLLTEERVGLMVWSPLAGGLLSGKFGPGSNGPEGARRVSFDFPPVDRDRAWACIAAMREIGDSHGVSVARVALAWLLHKPVVTSIIIGARSREQLHDNIAATTLHLSAAEMKTLDEISVLPAEYPGWMVARQAEIRRPKGVMPKT